MRQSGSVFHSRASTTSCCNQSLVFVRYAPRHGSHPWLIPSLHLRGHAHSASACTILPGSDGGLMTCSLYTAINLFIGHLPGSWRYISSHWAYLYKRMSMDTTPSTRVPMCCSGGPHRWVYVPVTADRLLPLSHRNWLNPTPHHGWLGQIPLAALLFDGKALLAAGT